MRTPERPRPRETTDADIDFRLVFESAPGLLLVLRPDAPRFTILGATDAYLDAVAREREAIVGFGVFEAFPDRPDDPDASGVRKLQASLERVIATRAADTMAVQKYDIPRPDARGGSFEERYWSPVNVPAFYGDGEIAYILHRVEDVTEFVQAARSEEKTERVQPGDDRAELRAYIGALQQANEELEAFNQSVSHDLRSPLTVITGYSDMMLSNPDGTLDASQRLKLGRIHESALRIATLIDDLMALARVNRIRMQVESVDLSKLATTIAGQLREAEPSRSVAVEIGDGLLVEGDARLLTIALESLLGNAWKYTSKRADARIELDALALEGERVFFVRDNGAGFDMMSVDHLFTPFERLHLSSELAGTGIGLTTVRRVIERHAGRIWVTAAEGEGATFFFTIGTTGESH